MDLTYNYFNDIFTNLHGGIIGGIFGRTLICDNVAIPKNEQNILVGQGPLVPLTLKVRL